MRYLCTPTCTSDYFSGFDGQCVACCKRNIQNARACYEPFPTTRSCNHEDGQIFTPPYLLNPDGTDATRPTVAATSRTVAVGGTITAAANEPASKFSLVRRGCGLLKSQSGCFCHGKQADMMRCAMVSGKSLWAHVLRVPLRCLCPDLLLRQRCSAGEA